ncbi:hypothetical protein [Streptomyces sp. CA-111067]|uniref:hypothetical protein n=1 Tax=Streptomyces sp. CA-111067 TaxID=3240046 RepID=UPI003D95EF6F
MAEQLRSAGLTAEFGGLKADVNVIGEGVVSLGSIRPEVAAGLAGLLGAGLVMEMLAQWDSAEQTDLAGADPSAE